MLIASKEGEDAGELSNWIVGDDGDEFIAAEEADEDDTNRATFPPDAIDVDADDARRLPVATLLPDADVDNDDENDDPEGGGFDVDGPVTDDDDPGSAAK